MGRLTTEVTRLVADIQATRGERDRLIRALRQASAEMRRAVVRMRGGFRAAHAHMAKRQERGLHEFTSGLRGRVMGLRQGLRTDLAGARAAWMGKVAAPAGREHAKRARA